MKIKNTKRNLLYFLLGLIFLVAISTVVGYLFHLNNASSSEEPFRNVMLIGWDGVERERLYGLLSEFRLPNLQKIIDEGAIVNITVTTGRTDTKAGWSEILTGYTATITGVHSNSDYKPIPKGYTIFERLENRFGKENIVTIFLGGKINNIAARGPHKICVNCMTRDDRREKTAWWDENTEAPTKDGEPKIFEEREGEPYYYTKDSLDVFTIALNSSSNVGPRAIEYLERYKDERFFFFVHFEEPDETGHIYGGSSVQYARDLIMDDDWLGEIVSKLKELGLYDETLIYVVTDHGFSQTVNGHYDHRYQPYIFMATNDGLFKGKSVKTEGDRKDITPTLLWRYGFKLDRISPALDGIPFIR